MNPTGDLQGAEQADRAGRLAGKVAIVTGAGQAPGQNVGNGRATAIVFAREGARVALLDRERASAEETAREIEQAGGLVLATHERPGLESCECFPD